MTLLRLISWPYIRKHIGRWLLTVAGIVIGVAVFAGMHTANKSVLYAFRQTINRVAGATQLQITAGETGVAEGVLERVQANPDVRVAVPVIEAPVNTGIRGEGNLLILGVDMLGDRSLREYDFGDAEDAIDDPLVFLAQPDSLLVTKTFADENGLHVGSKLALRTMEGEKQFTVRGIMRPGGLASAFGGNLAVMDVYAAEKVFGRGRRFDRIDLAVKDGVRVEDCQTRLEKMLGPGFQVEAPSARGAEFESTMRTYSLLSDLTSVFALFIGMFIIYNTFAIAVTERRAEIGILRALGATRRQIQMLFLTEGAVSGLVGSAAGVVFGILLARAIAGYISGLLGEVYGVPQRAGEISADPVLLSAALGIGVVTSVIAAFAPARSAAHVDPVKALQKGKYQVLSEGENRTRRVAAFVAIALSLACLAFSRYPPVVYAGFVLMLLAALLLTPALSLWISRGLRPVLKILLPVEGTLAADSLLQAPRRTSGAVAALMLSLALVVALGGMARASYRSITRWMEVALNPDLFVTPSESLTSRSFRFPASIGEGLRQIEGIQDVQFVRDARVPIRGTPILLIATDISDLRKHTRLPPVAGDANSMYRLAAEGKAVVVSDNFALLHGYRPRDVLDIPTPKGILRLPIAGIVTDYSDQQGSVLLDRKLFIQYWNDTSVNVFRVYLKPGVSDAEVKRRILEKYGNRARLFVLTNKDVRRYILRLTDQWFGLTYVQIAVAVLVAVLGIVNTLTVSIADRRRELGILRAVGGFRQQVRRTIWMEALAVGLVGLVLGLALGAIQLHYSLLISEREISGVRLQYAYPVQIAFLLFPVILGTAFLAALGPAEVAVRGSLVEALEYE